MKTDIAVADKGLQRKLIHSKAVVDKVIGRIDMGAVMSTHGKLRQVADVTVFY